MQPCISCAQVHVNIELNAAYDAIECRVAVGMMNHTLSNAHELRKQRALSLFFLLMELLVAEVSACLQKSSSKAANRSEQGMHAEATFPKDAVNTTHLPGDAQHVYSCSCTRALQQWCYAFMVFMKGPNACFYTCKACGIVVLLFELLLAFDLHLPVAKRRVISAVPDSTPFVLLPQPCQSLPAQWATITALFSHVPAAGLQLSCRAAGCTFKLACDCVYRQN